MDSNLLVALFHLSLSALIFLNAALFAHFLLFLSSLSIVHLLDSCSFYAGSFTSCLVVYTAQEFSR